MINFIKNFKIDTMKLKSFLFLMILFQLEIVGQSDYPKDYLSKEFHEGRRSAFRESMPANSVAIIFAFSERLFSNDMNYKYHPNPDLYYLTGYTEPNACLLLFKEHQGSSENGYSELFFVRNHDEWMEMWTGKRLGVEGVRDKLGFMNVKYGSEFKDFDIDFSKFSHILHDKIITEFQKDNTGYDVIGLVETFIKKANIKIDPKTDRVIAIHNALKEYLELDMLSYLIPAYEKLMIDNEVARNDDILKRVISNPDSAAIEKIKKDIIFVETSVDKYNAVINNLREVKTEEELVLLRKAVDLSCIGHNEVIRACEPQMGENHAHGIHLYVHKHYNAEGEGYEPIVGAGANGCILHYDQNIKTKLNNELLLMDVGAEYHGYTADVTRTFPPNGKFSPEQKAIYQIVYEAQEEVFKICKEGTPFEELQNVAMEVIADGLQKLGIIKESSEAEIYYPHGCSHYLGLDVHDRGTYGLLKVNSVITVEPGIYIPEGSDCDPKWWNIGVRIEDDVVILKDSYELLSDLSPRKWDEVEQLAQERSIFNDLKLPEIGH